MRLTKISTRTGDDGMTGLADGTRVSKDDLRIGVIGDIDELNSLLGLVLAEPVGEAFSDLVESIQQDLFEFGAELCQPGKLRLGISHVSKLDWHLERINGALPPLKEFILPGGTRAAALCHVARAVCRRAERELVGLSRKAEIGPESLRYLNRLSDLLFVLARTINREAGRAERFWKPNIPGADRI